MAKIDTLQEKLKSLAEKERDVFRSKERRQFFIEWFPADNLDKLVEEFRPDEHNSEWEAEFQKLKQNTADIDKIIKNRRAVAYMYSGLKCVKKHYGENELTLHLMGYPRMNWVLNELQQLKDTQQEGQPIWAAKE